MGAHKPWNTLKLPQDKDALCYRIPQTPTYNQPSVSLQLPVTPSLSSRSPFMSVPLTFHITSLLLFLHLAHSSFSCDLRHASIGTQPTHCHCVTVIDDEPPTVLTLSPFTVTLVSPDTSFLAESIDWVQDVSTLLFLKAEGAVGQVCSVVELCVFGHAVTKLALLTMCQVLQ